MLTVTSVEVVLLISVLANLARLDIRAGERELALGQTHAAEVLDGILPLLVLSRLAPLVLIGHHVDNLGQGLEGSLSVQESKTGAAGNDIDGGLCVLVAHSVADLTVNEGVEIADAVAADGEALFSRFAEGGDLPGAVTVRLGEVLGDFGLDAVVLDQVDEEGLAPTVSSNESDLMGLAGTVEVGCIVEAFRARDARRVGQGTGRELEFLDGFVDSLLGHLTVSGPLATRAGDQTALAGGDEMVADETFRLGLVGVADKRTDTRPGGKDVATADSDFGLQVVLDFGENPVDLLLASDGVLVDIARSVGGSGNGVALPGKEENDTAVRGVRVNHTHVGGSVVTGKNNVDTRRRSDDLGDLLVVHLADRVGERTSSVDDTLCANVELVGATVGLGDQILDTGAIESAVFVLGERGNFDVVDNSCAVESSGHAERDVHAGVVVGTICCCQYTQSPKNLQAEQNLP